MGKTVHKHGYGWRKSRHKGYSYVKSTYAFYNEKYCKTHLRLSLYSIFSSSKKFLRPIKQKNRPVEKKKKSFGSINLLSRLDDNKVVLRFVVY